VAFVLKKSGSYSWPVHFDIPIDGGRFERQTFDCEFKQISQTRIREISEGIGSDGMTDADVAAEVLVGWSGVTDDNGKDVPFSQSALADLLEVPMLASAIVLAYFDSLQGAKRKN
jgi:hypothetical protein